MPQPFACVVQLLRSLALASGRNVLYAGGVEELFGIVAETEDLLVINKPAGLVCHPTKGDAYSSLISRVRLHCGESVRPELINRLDRETSGLVLVGKRPQTALELRRIWETREVQKVYWAIVHGHVAQEHGAIDAPLGRDEESIVAIKDKVRADGAAAHTGYSVLSRFARDEGEFTLLDVRPLTGRKHQIRIHLAHIGHAIVGDKLYGGDPNVYLDFVKYRLTPEQCKELILPNHALHARQVCFHWRGEEQSFCAEPETWFAEFAAIGIADRRQKTPACE